MSKKFIPILILISLLIAGCSSTSAPSQNTRASEQCENIVKQFNTKLLSESKNEKVQGWQMVLDNPNCFLSNAVEIAKTEISALNNKA